MRSAFAIHRALLRVALSGGLLFAWVIFLEWQFARTGTLSVALGQAALAFAFFQIVVILATPVAARFFAGGMVRAMILALAALAASFVALGATVSGAVDPGSGIVAFAALLGIYRGFYATPFALVQGGLGMESTLLEIVFACVPLEVGFMLEAAGVSAAAVLFGAAFFALLSIVPLMRFNAYERFEWSYRETFGMLLEPVHRSFVVGSAVRGFEGAALFFLWPLFVFVMLDYSALGLGVVLTASLLLVIAAHALVSHPRRAPSSLTTAIAATGSWIARFFAVGPVSIVLVQAFGTGDARRMREHLMNETYADGGSFLDELTALKEISLALGRLAFVLFFAALVHIGSFGVAVATVFALAAVAAAYSAAAGR